VSTTLQAVLIALTDWRRRIDLRWFDWLFVGR